MPIDSEVVGAGQPAEPTIDPADTQQPEEGAQPAPAENEYKFVLATGQRYRTEEDLVRAQESASLTIDTLKAQALMLQQQLQQQAAMAQQATQPQPAQQDELDPEFQAQYRSIYQGLVDGGAAPEFADTYARREASRSLGMMRQLQGQISSQVGSLQKAIYEREYQQLVEKDPSFDFHAAQADPKTAYVWEIILKARPDGSPSEHYQMFSKLTNRSLSPETKALIQQQADQRRDALRMPAGSGSSPNAAVNLDSPEVKASMDQWLRFQRAAGKQPNQQEIDRQRQFMAQRAAGRQEV